MPWRVMWSKMWRITKLALSGELVNAHHVSALGSMHVSHNMKSKRPRPAAASAERSAAVTFSVHARIRMALRSRKLCLRYITTVNAEDPA